MPRREKRDYRPEEGDVTRSDDTMKIIAGQFHGNVFPDVKKKYSS